MEDFKTLAGASATILAALVASAVTFLVSVFTKESKTSEFRQAWIDALRNDLAKIVGIWWHIANEFDRGAKAPEILNESEFWDRLKPELLDLEELQTRIELRLNPREHMDLIVMVRRLGGAHDFIDVEFAERKSAIDELTSESQRVLKSEWRRVKRGEPVYRCVKWISLVALILAAVIVCVAVFVRLNSVR